MKYKIFVSLFISALVVLTTFWVKASVIADSDADLNADAGLITFSASGFSHVNRTYAPVVFGGRPTDSIVNFDGFFTRNSRSANPGVDCPGAAAITCIVGTLTGPISLDAASPDTLITNAVAMAASPFRPGSPLPKGGNARQSGGGQFGAGINGGFANAVGNTGRSAFNRDGNIPDTGSNTSLDNDSPGLVTDDNTISTTGERRNAVGEEPVDVARDNSRFGLVGSITVNQVSEPPMVALIGAGLILLGIANRKKRQ